jgi:HAD superfamily hydrolase (TIGR01549 family)
MLDGLALGHRDLRRREGSMKPPRFKALIFDMDGTLTRPFLDFRVIRQEIDIPSGDIVHELQKRSPEKQREAWSVIEAHEERALEEQELQAGCLALLEKCVRCDIRLGVVTRNARRSVDHFMKRWGVRFDGIITREFEPLKPHPASVLHLLDRWQMPADEALMIGDYLFDIDCGRSAGTATCFFHNPGASFHGDHADYVVSSMSELDRIVFGE